MREHFGFVGAAALALTSCLSETLIDNYRDGPVPSGALAGGAANSTAVADKPETSVQNDYGTSIGAGFVPLSSKADASTLGGASSTGVSGYRTMGFWQAGSLGRLQFGVTDHDHVILLVEVTDESNEPWVRLAELAPSGGTLRMLDLPRAVMPDVSQLQPDGAMIFAGELGRDVNFGLTNLSKRTNGYYVVKLDADWHEQFAFSDSVEQAVTLTDIAQSRDGVVHLATNEVGVLGIDSNGVVTHEFAGVKDARFAIDERAAFIAGWFDSRLEVGQSDELSSGGRDAVVVGWDASTLSASSVWRLDGADDDTVSRIAMDSQGNLIVGGRAGGDTAVFDSVPALGTKTAVFVASVNPSGALDWSSNLGQAGRVADIATRSSSIYVATYSLAASEMLLTVTGFSQTGKKLSSFSFDRQPDGYGQIEVDSGGVIWLSALGQIQVAGSAQPRSVSALYRIVLGGSASADY